MEKTNQRGFSIIEVLLTLVVVGILGFTGWFVYHSRTVADKGYSSTNTQSQTPSPRYVNFGSKGLVLASKADVAKLTGAGAALKQYFDANIGIPVQDPATFGTNNSTKTVPQTFTVWNLYGNYATAEGNGDDFGSILGPKADGSVGALVSGQNDLFGCGQLTAAHVPAVLVDGECADNSGNTRTYKG